MNDEIFYPTDYYEIEKIKRLHYAASQCYKLSEVLQAANIYKEALSLAEKIDDKQQIVELRRWCGASFYEAGKLHDALSVLVPVMKDKPDVMNMEHFYVSTIKYIEIAQELPVSLKSIEKGHSNIEKLLNDLGYKEWRHMQLRKLSELFKIRGMYKQSIDLGLESWALYQSNQSNGPGFLPDEYLYNLSQLFLITHNFDETKYLLNEWELVDSYVPSYKEMTTLIRQSEFSRVTGDLINAVRYAERAKMIAKITRHYWRLKCSIKALIRAYICTSQFDNANYELKELCEDRRSESLHERYDFHLLRGDSYLAYARFLLGANLYDDEFGLELFPLNSELTDNKIIVQEYSDYNITDNEGLIELLDKVMITLKHKLSDNDENEVTEQPDTVTKKIFINKKSENINPINLLRHAQQAYSTALHVGQKIDSLLECNVHSENISKRFHCVAELKKS